jgi:hypothetical protein
MGHQRLAGGRQVAAVNGGFHSLEPGGVEVQVFKE